MTIGLTIDQIALVAVAAAGVLVVALGVAIVVMGWKDADVKEDDDERIER